jgi:transposase-like protein
MGRIEKFIKLDDRRYYSESFKKHVVNEVESGRLTKEEAKLKYKLGGNSAVLNWCRKYGKSDIYTTRNKTMKNTDALETAYEKRLKELESELSISKLRTRYLETVIEVAGQKLGVSIEKKSESKSVKSTSRKKKE